MAETTYFDDELTRLRKLWLLAVQGGDIQATRDASTAYFNWAGRLTATANRKDHVVRQAGPSRGVCAPAKAKPAGD